MKPRPVLARFFWLCPVVSVVLAAGVFILVGVKVWTAVIAAVLLGCPIAVAWTLVAGRLSHREEPR
jgi:hypothetical protein